MPTEAGGVSLTHPRIKCGVIEQTQSIFMAFLTSAWIVAHEQKVTRSTRPVRNTPRLDMPPQGVAHMHVPSPGSIVRSVQVETVNC